MYLFILMILHITIYIRYAYIDLCILFEYLWKQAKVGHSTYPENSSGLIRPNGQAQPVVGAA